MCGDELDAHTVTASEPVCADREDEEAKENTVIISDTVFNKTLNINCERFPDK